MLKSLHIRNYAIIKEVDIHFHHKLNIITGETGAGKSILMGALGLILGERADAKALMNEEEKCVIEGSFDVKAYSLKPVFESHELDYDHTCIIRREIAPNGKSRAFINDTPVNLNLLKEIGEKLVDIVSQHQTLELNDASFQLEIVDAVAESYTQLADYKKTYTQFKQAEKQLRELKEKEEKARADEDYFRFILNELTEANIDAAEQPNLEARLSTLSHAEHILQASSGAYGLLDGNEQSVLDQLRNIKNTLGAATKFHAPMQELVQRLESGIIELKDIAAELEGITESVQADPEELNRIETRLQLLFNLQKKHRVENNTQLLELQQKLQHDIDAIGSLQQEISETEEQLKVLQKQIATQAAALTAVRAKAIPTIEKQINSLLKQVQMPDAQIKIEQTTLADQFTPNGTDNITFLFTANKGSQFQPISKVASGGELSRLMLCIKSLISDKIALPTIVFDEIDTGISGEAALKVSQVMKTHAGKHQVIAITHLPQIAGKADAHFYVYKTSDKLHTSTHIKQLNEQERLEEIARMLHGANPSEKVLEAARELIG